jgi:antitoxin ParD1/3/4
MEIWFDPETEAWIAEEVRSGRYATAGEVVREAVLRLRQQDIPLDEVAAQFSKELDETLASLDRGESFDPEVVRADIARRSSERRRKTA